MSEHIVQTMSSDRIEKLYQASNYSSELIKQYCSGDLSQWPELDQEQAHYEILLNKEHLEYMLTLDLWADKDISGWSTAISIANEYLT